MTTSRYRCRLHSDYVVTWKGTGCIACAEEANRRARAPRRRVRPDELEIDCDQ